MFLDYRTAFVDDAGAAAICGPIFTATIATASSLFEGKGLPPEPELADDTTCASRS